MPIGNPIHPNLQDSGYTPSFGKKGSGGMPQPHMFSLPIDLDNPIPNEPSLHSNYVGNNSQSHLNNNYPNIGNATRATNNSSLTVTTNFEDDSLQQHRARIWSTLKPSALATFPVATHSDTPKRRFSGRTRKEPATLDHNSFTDYSNVNSNYGYGSTI